ncbi:flagellin [Methylobacterium sp. PvR107]|uniref:flagellin n=1 Tax=Methylobacterium sp. PvR107 TaxID=2806597 RepID=UPI001AE9E180|nr:flagellin [Methylobacterium sp. PvR107]MBP1180109.1 flagellin-like hook-associated protein FlgL [Methylobacterium sp. PvR107]
MTTIKPFAAGSYLTTRNAAQLTTLKNQLNDLSTQLSSGLTAQTYGGLGSGRSTALSAQATLSALTGYAAGINAAQTRTNVAVTSLTQVATLGIDARNTLNNGLQSTPVNATAAKTNALNNLQAALDTLNQSVAGNYLFGGANSSTQPVLDADTILNGNGTQIGLKTFVANQVAADVGPLKNGRLSQTYPTLDSNGVPINTKITLSDDPSSQVSPRSGYVITGASALPIAGGIAANYVSGSTGMSNAVTIDVNQQPVAGDSLTLTLQLPDNTTTTVTLTAAASGTTPASSSTGFAIGADAAATAKNLNDALTSALSASAGSTLTANSTARAASAFFSAPNATTTAANTVVWYQGENGSTDPLSTQSVQVSAGSSVQVGVRANQPAISNVLAGLATVALGMPSSSDPNAAAIYSAISGKAQPLLSSADTSPGTSSTGALPSVQDTVTQLSLASTRMSNAATTNKASQNTLQNTLAGIEQAPTEEVVAKLLDVQNRLQASYQVTASLSKLSLVNYIS